MKTLKWMLLLLSALLYAAAHVLSSSLWWLTFFAWSPLFYCAVKERLSFKEGFFWGIAAFYGNMWGIFYSLTAMAEGFFIFRIFPAVLVTSYLALYGGVWFWLSSKLVRLLSLEQSVSGRLILWTITAWFFILWLHYGCLWIFNRFEGYFLMHPLLPLAEFIEILGLLPSLGSSVLSLFLVMTNALFAALFLTPHKRLIPFLGALAVTPWALSWLSRPEKKPIPSWVDKVGVVPSWIYEPIDLSKIGKTVQEKLKKLLEEKPHVQVALLPESALYQCNLESAKELAYAWSDRYLAKPLTVVVGAARWEKDNCYNTAYLVKNGTIEARYDKRHRMILTEGLAPWWNIPFVHSLFYRTSNPLTASEKPHPQWEIIPGVFVVPYICSELFFNPRADDSWVDLPLLVLCNDTWSSIHYVRRLMYLSARFKAVEWKRDVLYAGYEYAVFCGKFGSLSRSLSHNA